MFVKGSRYRNARPFTAEDDAATPFPGVRPRQIDAATGVIEHSVEAGDRPDLLARHYYNDDRLWWRILDANPELFYGGDAVLENDLVLDNGEAVESDQPDPGAEILRRAMVGRVLLIPKATE